MPRSTAATLTLALSGVLVLGSPGRPAAAPSSGLTLSPCEHPPGARCGTLDVFEDRDARAGRTIPLHVVVLPATGASPAPDPIFMLAGGPGQSASAFLQGGVEPFDGFRRSRDLVLVDQRGTGRSNRLPCALFGRPSDPATLFADIFPLEEVRACREALSARADLTKYGTIPAMDDLDDVRAALGYGRINLWGGSYGTFAAQVYMRRHPGRVRAAVLEGAASLDYKLPLPFARGFQNAMERLISDCNADPACSASVPKLREEFEALLARLDREPARFTFRGKPVVMTRGSFLERLRVLIYAPQTSALVPLIVQRAHAGDYETFAKLVALRESALIEGLSMGMYLSVTCSEGLAFATPAEIERATAGTWMGDYRVRTHARACEEWPRAKLPADFIEPVASEAPVLLVAGEFDPVTPPAVAESAASRMPNARVVMVPGASHVTQSPCVEGVIASFLEKGSAKDLDLSCVREGRRPPFPAELPALPDPPS
jgi:pimeloyl-ACP methyl ester carboxylesterase